MSLAKIAYPPGIYRNGTVYQSMGRWYAGQFCRWSAEGVGPMPEGGWTARTVGAMSGKARAILAWRDNDDVRYFAVGTHSKLYATTASDTTMHDITPVGFVAGDADASTGGGYGSGPYGEDTYGTPRADIFDVQDAAMWSMDTFGEDLLACAAQDGIIYRWQLNVAVAAATLTNAPTGCSGVVVTPEKFVVALAAGGDKRAVAWSDQEAPTIWTPTATNQAGDLTLATQGKIMCGRRLRSATLIWTDLDVHQMRYLGPPYVYSIERQGENCGIVSRGAVVVVDTMAFWMTPNDDFRVFDGYVREVPCEIKDAIFGDFNRTQKSKITAFHNAKYGEVHWLYCSGSSTEIDRRAVYNYRGNFWNLHDLSGMTSTRLCGQDRGVFNNPLQVGADGIVYDHETGSSYDSASPYFESGPQELGNGDRISRVRRLIFDEQTSGDVSLTVYSRDWPNDSETTHGPYTSDNPTPCRIAGRQLRIKGTFSSPTSASRWGVLRADLMQGSMR